MGKVGRPALYSKLYIEFGENPAGERCRLLIPEEWEDGMFTQVAGVAVAE